MRTVQQLYDEYRIMPSLQLHMLRVAAVAKTLCDSVTEDIDEDTVILACLFHDTGNIIKSDLALFPEFLEPEGRAHWEMVKADFIGIYGGNAHEANVAIAEQIGLNADAVRLIDGIGFSRMSQIRENDDVAQKVVEYSDLRVSPHGVVSLSARLDEGKWRYEYNHPGKTRHATEWEQLRTFAFAIEKELFADAAIAPDDITEQSAQRLFDEFRALRVP